MESVIIDGMKGNKSWFRGFCGVGYKIEKPYYELAAEVRKARAKLLNHVQASTGSEENPLIFTVSPPENIARLEDVHTLYLLVDEKSFGKASIPEELYRMAVPGQNVIVFQYRGATQNSMNFYRELFAQIGNGNIDYDRQGYRIEAYDEKHNWDHVEDINNTYMIYFPVL